MSNLARKLRLADYFALAFGAMVGVGWLALIEDWPDAATKNSPASTKDDSALIESEHLKVGQL